MTDLTAAERQRRRQRRLQDRKADGRCVGDAHKSRSVKKRPARSSGPRINRIMRKGETTITVEYPSMHHVCRLIKLNDAYLTLTVAELRGAPLAPYTAPHRRVMSNA